MKRIVAPVMVLLSGTLFQCVSLEHSDLARDLQADCLPPAGVEDPWSAGLTRRETVTGDRIPCRPVGTPPALAARYRSSYYGLYGSPSSPHHRQPSATPRPHGTGPSLPRAPHPTVRHHHHNPFHVPAGRYKNSTNPRKWRL